METQRKLSNLSKVNCQKGVEKEYNLSISRSKV